MRLFKPDEETATLALSQIEAALDQCEQLKIIDNTKRSGEKKYRIMKLVFIIFFLLSRFQLNNLDF
jgi:hypothetical protein